MKVLLEVPLETSECRGSQFEWLSDPSNRLFLIESGKRLRTISVGSEPGKVLESANLADGRVCTNFSWNKDGNQLAMVVDKRLIYFWDVRDNNLLHYKPSIKTSSDTSPATAKNRAKDVEQIVWSKVTNKVAIGYSTGQLLLCRHESGWSETLVDNSSGVLREISRIESSPHLDVFACTTVIFELLVMTFDGDAIFYNQAGDNGTIRVMRFSPPFDSRKSTQATKIGPIASSVNQSFWLAHSSQDTQICLKLIVLKEQHSSEVWPSNNLVYQVDSDEDNLERVVYYEWVDSSSLLVCSASGIISLLQLKSSTDKSGAFQLSTVKMMEIHTTREDLSLSDAIESLPNRQCFKSFELMMSHQDHPNNQQQEDQAKRLAIYGRSLSFSAMTDHRLFYYELLEMDSMNGRCRYTFEKIDELDLTASLNRIGLNLERLQWSSDSSMLAVQLSNGHILIYQTRLRDHMVTSYGSQTAYMSEPNEVTILNYGVIGESDELIESNNSSNGCSPIDKDTGTNLERTNKASIIKVDMEPSVIAIGPKHLAIGLNNLVRFYSTHSGQLESQEEYHSIVSSICLCLKFVGVQLDDGRVKLHPLRGLNNPRLEGFKTTMVDSLNERYFPDPTKPETISAFTLTDRLFMYCTSSFNLNVFCLRKWIHIQSFNYLRATESQTIVKLVPDGRGNKYLCLVDTLSPNQCRVFLYDSYRNEMISFLKENKLYARIYRSQLELVPSVGDHRTGLVSIPLGVLAKRFGSAVADLSRILSVIWDTDGRSVLLVERKCIHIYVILDHTLESEGPIIEWVTTVGKQSTYATLYASHGVLSSQTSLGRVINSIAESHNDEAKLSELSKRIQATVSRLTDTAGGLVDEVQAEIMQLKLEYLQMIVLIYPLSKCAEICEYIMSDQQFNVAEELRRPQIDDVLWRQLAARALFTSNLQFALLVYKRRRLLVYAQALADILQDSGHFSFDSKTSITTRLLMLLGCDHDDDVVEDE